MNEEIMNDTTMEIATQETAPAETETDSAGSTLAGIAILAGSMFLTTFAAMAGAGIGYTLLLDEEAKAERKERREERREARKAKREAKKAKKANKPVVVDDVTVEVNFDEEN